MEARDAAGTVLFTMGFDALPTAEARKAEALGNEDRAYAYDTAA